MSTGLVLKGMPVPTPPPVGFVRVFIDVSDGNWKVQDSAGVLTAISGIGPAGPTGPAGPQGDPGVAGPAGADGNTLLYGAVAPTTEGVDGNFYIDTVASLLYGPKTGGAWLTSVSLIGPTGPAGADGADGADGIGVPDPTLEADGLILVTSGGVLTYASPATGTTVTVGDTPPVSPADNELWWNSTPGIGAMFIYYNDGTSSQWVQASPAGLVESGAGSGDVTGPAVAVSANLAAFDGTTGKILADSGVSPATFATAAQGALADSAVQPNDPIAINAQVGTTYTLVLADAGKLVTCANASPITVTVPTNASVAYELGTVISLQQMGVGILSVVGATGVTINGVSPGSEALTDAPYLSIASLTKHAADIWTLTGSVA